MSSERELVAALRAELAAIDPARACDRAAELVGLGTSAIRGDRPALGRLMVRLLRDERGREAAAAFSWDRGADHCRSAYLRGLFLARGSLSLTGGRHHLEFVVPPAAVAELAERLAAVGLPAAVRVRRGRGVVTWKSAETIGTFLRWIGARSAVLELEARQVARALRGDLNRILNAESANLERVALAAARQLEAIETLVADGRLERCPPAVRAVAALRRETPEAPISELAAELGLGRARVQRALERIKALAEMPAAPEAERPPRGRAGGPSPDRPAMA